MDTVTKSQGRAAPWNKGKLLGRKPRGSDLVGLRVHDVDRGSRIARRLDRDGTSEAGAIPLSEPDVGVRSPHVSTRQHSRVVGSWVASIGAWVSCAPQDDSDSYRRDGQPHFCAAPQISIVPRPHAGFDSEMLACGPMHACGCHHRRRIDQFTVSWNAVPR